MKATNPHQPFINRVGELIDEANLLAPRKEGEAQPADITLIIGGLHTARDYAIKHGESVLAVLAAEAEAAAQKAAKPAASTSEVLGQK